MTKIAIVIGSTRPGRVGAQVGEWVARAASQRTDAEFTVVDIADANLPVLDEPIPAAAGKYQQEHTKAWAATIAPYDGYVFVTPEYNHGVPGAMKNAVDYLYNEWVDKAIGFVSYGANDGVRAVEQWRQIVANMRMYDVRAQCSMNVFSEFPDGTFTPHERREGELKDVLDQVVAAAQACATLRK